MKRYGVVTVVQASAGLALLSLSLVVWSIFDPTPMPIIVSMSVGQGIGLLSLGLYLFAIYLELRRSLRARRDAATSPTEE